MGRRETRGGGVKLSCRCYQVKPPTTGCRHGDTMVTTRCSTRKEHDLAYVKGLPLSVCVSSSLFLSPSESFSRIICLHGVCTCKKNHCTSHPANHPPPFYKFLLLRSVSVSVQLKLGLVNHSRKQQFIVAAVNNLFSVCTKCTHTHEYPMRLSAWLRVYAYSMFLCPRIFCICMEKKQKQKLQRWSLPDLLQAALPCMWTVCLRGQCWGQCMCMCVYMSLCGSSILKPKSWFDNVLTGISVSIRWC